MFLGVRFDHLDLSINILCVFQEGLNLVIWSGVCDFWKRIVFGKQRYCRPDVQINILKSASYSQSVIQIAAVSTKQMKLIHIYYLIVSVYWSLCLLFFYVWGGGVVLCECGIKKE